MKNLSKWHLARHKPYSGVRCRMQYDGVVQIPGAISPERRHFVLLRVICTVLSMKLASCQLSGAKDFELTVRFLENLCTPAVRRVWCMFSAPAVVSAKGRTS